ncbi:hypothetical protein EZV62_007220 [Acer yangbiense]|uniref:PGG domain-containing protein n=1 Tax=Acer yangbiense TaxID=1000413 RepID=A0A5C7I9Q1_9ROSI|nr:hypothetical protein EZV62_007220 [Acer yangbiense]
MAEINSDDPTLPVHHEQDSGEEEVNSTHDDSRPVIIQLPDHNFSPSLELLSNGERYFQICVPLRKAALKGNLKEFYNILRVHKEILDMSSLLSMAITKGYATILHVAAGARQTTFVEEIINSIQPGDESTLLLQDINGNTSFCFAAAAGEVEIAKIMLNKNPNLNQAPLHGNHQTPLYKAVMFGRKEMASFLYDATSNANFWKQNELSALFFLSISTGLYVVYTSFYSHGLKDLGELLRYGAETVKKPSGAGSEPRRG